MSWKLSSLHSQVKQIEASHRAFAALRADGRVITWGDVAFGGTKR